MTSPTWSRLRIGVVGAFALALGIASRRWPLGRPLWDDHLGDAGYAARIVAVVAFARPGCTRVRLAFVGSAIGAAIDCFQLTGLPAERARAFRPLALVFGTTFAWADLVAQAERQLGRPIPPRRRLESSERDRRARASDLLRMESSPASAFPRGPRSAAVVLAAAALLALPGCGPSTPSAEPPARPDVIWIVVDTLRRDRLGCYGHTRDTSPALDGLAREALVFERAYTSAPWTTPAVGGLLTAQPPSSLGLAHERSRLPAAWTTAAELFAQAGYRTAAVVSHSYCSSLQGFDQGFEVFDETNVRGYAEATSPGVTSRALEQLARADERPLFLFVHYFDPHFAYLEHEAHPFRGTRAYAGPVRPGQRFEELERLVPSFGEADYERLLELYDSEIAFTDASIGKLLQALRARPRWDRTVVAVTADHGEEFGERRSIGHGTTLFGEAIDVPLLLRVPGRGAERLAAPVSTLGLLPTCAALAGLSDLPAQLGRDLLRDGPAEPVFVETNQGAVLRAVIDGSSKLIADLATRRSQLFHLRLDPHERADRAASQAAEVARLEELLARWLAVATEPRYAPEEAQLDEAALERLRSLGYLGGR